MTVPCQVSAAEMREAFRLNLNSSACWKIARGNARSLIYVVVFLALIVVEIAKGGSINWQQVGLCAGVLAVILGLFWFSVSRTIAKTAKTLSASGVTLTIDTQGIAAELANGTRTSVPWSAISRWREGRLVFTIGDVPTAGHEELQHAHIPLAAFALTPRDVEVLLATAQSIVEEIAGGKLKFFPLTIENAEIPGFVGERR